MITIIDPGELEAAVEHGYAESQGVRIHCAALGSGPLLILIHGFPDFWYTWRHQMPALAREHRVVAMDLRGYNLSMPHPATVTRELAHNPAQYASSEYARGFFNERAHLRLHPEDLVGWLPVAGLERERHLQALHRSSVQPMLHYYQRNYPRPPYPDTSPTLPPVEVPVLMIHGLADPAILPGGLDGTWEWVSAPLSILTLPGAGHFVRLDAAETVTTTLLSWLRNTPGRTGE